MEIIIKRIYEDNDTGGSIRILVDRLWPRGISKEDANLDEWWKEIAPSDELRIWFDHDPNKWLEFKKRYRKELNANKKILSERINVLDLSHTVILLYGAKDTEHNQALVLKEYLEAEF